MISDFQKRLFTSILQSSFFENLKSHKNAMESFFKIKTFKSRKKVMQPFFSIKNFKTVMVSFFNIKNFKSRKAVMEFFLSFKSFESRAKVNESFFSTHASLSFHMMHKFPGTKFSLSVPIEFL